MRRPVALALDVGTSSVRALLVSAASGRVIRRHRVGGTRDGLRAVASEALLAEVDAALDAVEADLARAGERPLACGISLFWHSALLLDAKLRPLGPVRLWSDADPRFAEAARRLRQRVDAQGVRDAVGAPIHPSFPGVKAHALLAELPRAERRGVCLAGFEDVLALRLFGRLEKSLSMASGTGLWDGRRGRWHEAMVRAVGLAPGAMPAVAAADEEARVLAGEAAARWPHLAGVPWRLPRGDGALSNLGLGATAAIAGLTVGTSAALRLLKPPPHAGDLPWALFRYALDRERPVVGGALSAGGNLVAHMAALVGVRPAAAEALVARLPVGAEGVLVLPGFWGERSPGWPDEARGGVVGLRADTAPAVVVRAAMDAVGAGLGAVADALDQAFGPQAVARVRAGGGAIARSPALAQIAADAIGRPLDIVAGAEESSALGAAQLALALAGAGTAPTGRVVATFEPAAGGRQAYRELARRQEAARELVAGRRV